MTITFEWAKLFKKKLNILFVGAEAAPFAKAGGLGEVLFSLPLALKRLGQDARVFIPRYGTIDLKKYNLEMEIEGLKVPTGEEGPNEYLICNVKKYIGEDAPPTYFLENMEYYEKRANVYGYADDHIRWALLCRGVLEFLKKSSWVPEIIVCSDWHTGLVPNYLKTTYRKDETLSKIKTVLIIHNILYQGMCDFRFLPETERDNGREPIPPFFSERLAKLNWMLRGIIYSDLIVAVSKTYAKEILTPEFGMGLEKVLNEHRVKLHGIINGIDYKNYDPKTNPYIPQHYSVNSVEKKVKNKPPLQKRFGLKEDENIFLIGMPARLTEQKGFDLIEKIIEKVLKYLPLQLIFLGDGEARYKEMLKKAKEKFPEKIGFLFEFERKLPHLIYAGCDAILIPSKFEPCGIVQMEAMRYGAIPIARKTGGLADTIENFDPQKEEGTGFLFKAYEPYALFATICKAQTVFQIKRIWKKIVKLAMAQDFSWENSAKEYLNLFFNLINEK
jgi:starch synthase